jgi:hypothetical protein
MTRDVEALKKAAGHIHTPDSWARALAAAAVSADLAGKPLPGFSTEVHPECVQICIDTPVGRICGCF